jgi:uncharacterized protein
MKLSKILGKKIDFYKLLEEQAGFLIESVNALALYAETVNPEYSEMVKALEKEADNKRQELVQNLSKTFITPFDREDIYILSKSLDDILDYYKTAVNEIEIYRIESSPELIEFVALLQTGSQNICDAIFRIKSDPAASMENAMKAKKSENKVEALYRKSIADLLSGDDIKYIIKMRELYRHLSNCADRIDQAADFICHILMKEVS